MLLVMIDCNRLCGESIDIRGDRCFNVVGFVEGRSLVWWKCDILGDRFEIEIGGDAINRAILDFP